MFGSRSWLESLRPVGLRETTASYNSLLLRYDPTVTSYEALARVALEVAQAWAARHAGEAIAVPGHDESPVAVPVVYGGEYGPDLPEVAGRAGLDPEKVAARHCAAVCQVYMLGFAPGFAYLGGLDPALATPRRATPRPVVPAGSVGIAGEQTGVYPRALPGGWQLIGRTPLELWNPSCAEPALLTPGRRVRFVDAGRGAEGWATASEMARREEKRLRRPPREASPVQVGAARKTGLGSAGAEPSRPLARVLAAGPCDTVQDGGRWGYSSLGLPESGALDWPALAESNLEVGNPPGAAALEVTYGGLQLCFVAPAVFALGAGGRATLDGRAVEPLRATTASEGAVLAFAPGTRPRCYLALCGGGVAVPEVLGSRSTYLPGGLGGMDGRRLAVGDVVNGYHLSAGFETASHRTVRSESRDEAGPGSYERAAARSGDVTFVRAVPGPQEGAFETREIEAFFSREWTLLPSSDRRACLLNGEALTAPAGSGVSDGSPAGSVQVLPSGQPLVLLADHQTTGGYAKIATVVGLDLALLARTWPGQAIRFVRVGVEEARGTWLNVGVEAARRWTGNGPADPVEPLRLAPRTFVVNVKGRSHVVTVETAPPR